MKQLTAIIVECDTRGLLSTTRCIRQHCPEIRIIGKFTSPNKALLSASTLAPSVAFLEIHLTELTGIELAKKLQLLQIPIIFVSRNFQFALAALKIGAVDFLLKPIKRKELIDSVRKVKLGIQSKSQKLQNLVNSVNNFFVNKTSTCGYVALPTISDITVTNVENVLYCEGVGNYTKIIFKHGFEMTLSKTLSIIQLQLNPQLFFRAHNKYLVNIRHIKRVIRYGAGGILVMEDGAQLPLSKSKKKEFKNILATL
ncbi:MAG TPA: LytTR family DNA-binding domain-containing protein [Cyclobacteriaceae bacterium]|nr:LytTR family DNA-binding domain-containing protein [Cyclobacteriaceae bacterium]